MADQQQTNDNPKRTKNWLVDSPEYQIFAKICVDGKWHTRHNLARRQAMEAAALIHLHPTEMFSEADTIRV